VNEAVGGEDDGAAEWVRISGKIADFSAGFFDEQDSGGSVPLLETEFPEAVEAAGGDASEVQGGGAIAAHSVRVLREVAVVLKIRAGLAVAHGKAGAEQAGRERGAFGDVDFFAVEGSAVAARGSEKFVVKRIEDRGGEKRIVLGKRNRDAEARISVREIRGAVERIDVPAKFGSGSALMPGSLFGGDGMIGKIFGKALDDKAFRALVCLRDEIHLVAFVGEVQRTRQLFDEDSAGFLGDFDSGFEIVLRHWQFLGWFASRQAGTQLAAAAFSTLPLAATGFACREMRGRGPPHPGWFLAKSAESLEKKGVEFLLRAKECARA
jgi:hypothetical protein